MIATARLPIMRIKVLRRLLNSLAFMVPWVSSCAPRMDGGAAQGDATPCCSRYVNTPALTTTRRRYYTGAVGRRGLEGSWEVVDPFGTRSEERRVGKEGR